jgi:hypothetical protein
VVKDLNRFLAECKEKRTQFRQWRPDAEGKYSTAFDLVEHTYCRTSIQRNKTMVI